MKQRLVSVLLLAVMLLGSFGNFGCGNGGTTWKYTIREEAETVTKDYSDYNILPKPEGETQKDITVLNLDGASYADVFLGTSLQGNVNRTDPSIYVVHDYMVEGNAALNATQYWLDKLDETYLDENGEPYFVKHDYTAEDLYDLVLDHLDEISGVVLYHDRLVGADMLGSGNYGAIYSDVALLNLTVMMCGQYNAIAVTSRQYNALREAVAAEGLVMEEVLPILGDTTKFMKLDAEGEIDGSAASRMDSGVWTRVYEYALSKFDCSNKALVHNPGLQAATFDYAIQNKLFVYNRSLSTGSAGNASEAENQLEDDILAVTDLNTPVLGVWYLHLDEANYVNYLTGMGKSFCVSYESFNWSWSTGLPYETIETNEEEIEYDPEKIYLAFSFTEGDNNSYVHFKMPTLFDSSYRGQVPFSWTISPTTWETNPNMIRYFSMNWAKGDGLCIPEAGPVYVDPAPPENTEADFYALCDEYVKRIGNGNIRTLKADFVDALAYAEHMENLDSLLCSYGIGVSNNVELNTEAQDFLFRGVPYIMQLDGRNVYDTMKYIEDAGKQFYSISYSGWEHTLENVSDLMETLDERFVVVTQKQLAQLYRDAYAGDFEQVTEADFTPDMNRTEMGFLWQADSYGDYDSMRQVRYANGEDSFRYRFELADGVTEAVFDLSLSGNYTVEMSTDNRKFYEVATGSAGSQQNVRVEVPSFLLEQGKTLTVRLADGTPGNAADDGITLHRLTLNTNLSAVEGVQLLAGEDGAYLEEGGNEQIITVTEGLSTALARTGTFVYRLPLKEGITAGDVAVGLANATDPIKLSVSSDGESWDEVSLVVYGKTAYGKVSGLSGALWLKVESSGGVKSLLFSPLPEAVGSLSFRPLKNSTEARYSLSQDAATYEITSDIAAQQKGVETGNAMVYRFVLNPEVTEATLDLQIVGHYAVWISSDNINYTQLAKVSLGDPTADIDRSFDITDYLTDAGVIYLRVEESFGTAFSYANLRRIRIVTDQTESWLLDKIEIENTPVPVIKPNTNEEHYLIDTTLGDEPEYYVGQEGTWTKVNAVQDTKIVYKFDFTKTEENIKFWKSLGLDLETTELTALTAIFTVANSYKLEISADGQDWTVIKDYEGLVNGGSNKENVRFDMFPYLSEGTPSVVYVRFSRGKSWNGSDEALIAQIRLAFGVQATA